jgi:hypothetical protein
MGWNSFEKRPMGWDRIENFQDHPVSWDETFLKSIPSPWIKKF